MHIQSGVLGVPRVALVAPVSFVRIVNLHVVSEVGFSAENFSATWNAASQLFVVGWAAAHEKKFVNGLNQRVFQGEN